MPMRWGPGPVFIYESIAVSRRWQHYATRSFAVLTLLVGLTLVWVSISPDTHKNIASGSIHDVAEIGGSFYTAIAMVQITLVLLAAPAATAGAICLDRARGTLTHMLVTDLSDAEIVLGKLFARLAPVLALVAASLPVLSITTMLGGVGLEEVVWLTVVSLVMAGFGCALALAFSVRAKKTHEVLMAVYAVWCVVILGPLLWVVLCELTSFFVLPPNWLYLLDPYYLVLYFDPEPEMFASILTLAATVVLTLLLIGYAVWRLRGELTGRPRKLPAKRAVRVRPRRGSLWRVPSLDGNPVLWREWQHSRPSRTARIVWGLFLATIVFGTGSGIALTVLSGINVGAELIFLTHCLNVALGLLLVSLAAPTALAEERASGSLDVLLTTPLSTPSIVWGKWWAMYRVVPRLALLPVFGLVVMVLGAPTFPVNTKGSPLSILDGIATVIIPVAWILAQGAVVTSLGLLLATWFPRVGRAMALSVSACVAFTFGGFILLEFGIAELIASGFGYLEPRDKAIIELFETGLGSLNPIYSQYVPVIRLFGAGKNIPGGTLWCLEVAGLIVTVALAAALYGLTVLTFERCLGRVSERPRRPSNQTKRREVKPEADLAVLQAVGATQSAR